MTKRPFRLLLALAPALLLTPLLLAVPARADMPETPGPPAAEDVPDLGGGGIGLADVPGPAAPPFIAGTPLTAAALNNALRAPTITAGTINGAPIGTTNPQPGTFTSLTARNGLTANGTVLMGGNGVVQIGDGLTIRRTIFTGIMTPTSGQLLPSVLMQGNAYGTITYAGDVSTLRAFNINGDTVNAAGAQGGGLSANYFGHNISAGAVGGRTTLTTFLYHSGATTVPGTGNQFYVAMSATAASVASAGGTSGTPAGNLFATNFIARLKSGAGLYWHQVVGLEIDTEMAAGTQARDKVGLQIVQLATDAVQGTATDAGLAFANGTGGAQAIGWRHGILFGAGHGGWPMHPGGTLVGTAEQNTSLPARYPLKTANGIDFATVPIVFSGRAWASPGFAVDGTGQMVLGANTIGWSGAGLAVGATGKAATLASLSAVGNTFRATDILRDAYGGVWEVATVNGSGGITSLTMRNAPTITSGSAPSNPVALAGGMGAGATINLTWADAPAVTLTGTIVTPTSATPASSSAACTAGQQAWDASYRYACVATNTWRRAAHATW